MSFPQSLPLKMIGNSLSQREYSIDLKWLSREILKKILKKNFWKKNITPSMSIAAPVVQELTADTPYPASLLMQ
jgi:hypothetical protein